MDSKIIELIQSNDFKKRMAGEHKEVVTRTASLHRMIYKYEHGELEFVPTCPISILKSSLRLCRNMPIF